MLQCAVRQVRDAADVRLLPELGVRLGIPEERHPRRNTTLRGGHYQPARGRDGPILQLLPAGTEARRIRRYIFAQISRENDGGKRPQVRRRLCDFLQDRQVSEFFCFVFLL